MRRRGSGLRRSPLHGIALGASLILAIAAGNPPSGRAAGTRPILAMTSAEAFASTGGAITVDVHGAFDFDDLIQGTFVAGLIVYQGTTFARFDQAGSAVSGQAAFLSDGLDPTELSTLLALGVAAGAPAALAQMRADRLAVVLPPGFTGGDASVTLYAVYEGGAIASNTLAVTLP